MSKVVGHTNLQSVADNIWLMDGDCVDFFGFPYPTRMVIVRLNSGGLWVWSPIRYSSEAASQLLALGTIEHFVSPNKLHHLYLSEWSRAFPEAKIWGPRSTIRKRSDLHFQSPLDELAPKDWAEEIEQEWFNGSVFMDEVVFFHRESKTIILADLSENFGESFITAHWKTWQRVFARVWGIVEGKGYAPLEWRITFFRKRSTKLSKQRVLAWKPVRVIVAHGSWQRQNGQAYLEKSLSWIR